LEYYKVSLVGNETLVEELVVLKLTTQVEEKKSVGFESNVEGLKPAPFF